MNKVYCCDCNNVWTPPFSSGWAHCRVVKEVGYTEDPVRSTRFIIEYTCEELNSKNNCKFYQPKSIYRKLVTCLDGV